MFVFIIYLADAHNYVFQIWRIGLVRDLWQNNEISTVWPRKRMSKMLTIMVKLHGTVCMLVESMFVRSSVCSSATKSTIMYCGQTAGPISATFFVHVCTLTRYIHQPIFIQMLNVLNSFSGSKIWIKYVGKIIRKMRSSLVGTIDHTNRQDIKECQAGSSIKRARARVHTCPRVGIVGPQENGLR